jgi:hypothetical protein
MNDDLMFEYLVQMGQMRPEEAELKKKQAMVDALRKGSMTAPEGQMIGKHYVAPSLAQYASQLGQGLLAGQQQMGVDSGLRAMNSKQAMGLDAMRERMRRKQLGLTGDGTMDTGDYGAGY